MVKRYYCFVGDEGIADSAARGFAWVAETGGTVMTNSKQTYIQAFSLDTNKKYREFEGGLRRRGVVLGWLFRGGVVVRGKRLFLFLLNGGELAEIERKLDRRINPCDVEEVMLLVYNAESALDWIRCYSAELIGDAPNGWVKRVADKPNTDGMPEDIVRILHLVAETAAGYDNKLQWREVERLKGDMMKHIDRWRLVTPAQVKAKCHEFGMAIQDADKIADMLKKRLDGKRLVPRKGYGEGYNHVI